MTDGRAKMTEDRAYLHSIETDRVPAKRSADNVSLQAELNASMAERSGESQWEIPDPNSSLKRAGFDTPDAP